MAYKYTGYNPNNSRHVQKYVSEHYKRVPVYFDISFYNEVLKPVCDDLGVSVSGFIKQAVEKAVDDRRSGITEK